MSETRLIPISDEDVERLREVADHEWNDLTPEDEGVLRFLAARYEEQGITAEEAERLHDRAFEAKWGENDWHALRKLRSAFSGAASPTDNQGAGRE